MTVWNHTAADSQFAMLVHKRIAIQQCLLILDSVTVHWKALKLQRHFSDKLGKLWWKGKGKVCYGFLAFTVLKEISKHLWSIRGKNCFWEKQYTWVLQYSQLYIFGFCVLTYQYILSVTSNTKIRTAMTYCVFIFQHHSSSLFSLQIWIRI